MFIFHGARNIKKNTWWGWSILWYKTRQNIGRSRTRIQVLTPCYWRALSNVQFYSTFTTELQQGPNSGKSRHQHLQQKRSAVKILLHRSEHFINEDRERRVLQTNRYKKLMMKSLKTRMMLETIFERGQGLQSPPYATICYDVTKGPEDNWGISMTTEHALSRWRRNEAWAETSFCQNPKWSPEEVTPRVSRLPGSCWKLKQSRTRWFRFKTKHRLESWARNLSM